MAHSVDKLAFEDNRLADFDTAIASLYTTLYDEIPAGVQSFADAGALCCRIQGGLTAGDLMMLQHGHADELAGYRESFFHAISSQLGMAVAAYTGHEVLTQESSFDPATVSTMVRFELSPATQDEVDQREALRNWSEQVRRSSRRLKALHVQAREKQHALATQLREGLEKHEQENPPRTSSRPD